AILIKRLNIPDETMLTNFINIPLASASIAQVHAATLPNGEDVVVKIKRPGIDKLIRRDIAIMHTLAEWAERYTLAGRRFRANDIVSEFEHTLLDELDLLREAANASILKRNFAHSPMLYVPEIIWPYCRTDVLVMERIYGIPVAKTLELQRQGANLKVLAENCVHMFFTQVFRDCFFHADLHPGNLFVDLAQPEYPKLIAVDFGIMGTLSPRDQRYLAENMLAFFKRDYRRVAELHLESGWIPPDTRLGEFELAIAAVCEPIFEKPLTISQICFEKKEVVDNHILMIGDTAGLIHPLCGNGMAMAIHSAKMASELINKYLKYELQSRVELEKKYNQKWNANFSKRLKTGRLLSAILQKQKLTSVVLFFVVRMPFLLRRIIKETHGNPIILKD
ncbi:hypothetical protein K2X05_07025, partial [bacterium]|nr:hypothetical protein [bacterium]